MADEDNFTFSVKNIKHCEEKSNEFFKCATNNQKDINKCLAQLNTFKTCCEDAANLPDEEHKIHPLVLSLQYYFPRIFTSDLPRERTILADTLAYIAPQIFDPKEDDDDED
ncbi:hypothetical protein DFA_12043 [Cavenderia fasciculata]|uniref:Uncharacterized protein n=1 Tax=Cavenderia fasciculata TaxID=261658 RepID=F4QFH2_CACFS|nr:uncharacterized protein DFA_12043 [Cavenderia fasciculata]EGG14273.1 hypothetical protein DFA_12043 [Cavenderia fasciculata]|eukprot:XP_004350982.1 hypothetical protein DFA_12043 [Cavenderia fasciculata]